MTKEGSLDPAFLVGTLLQQTYQVEELVGEGGMAFVYRAKHQVLDTDVALKIMRREYAMRSDYRDRFLREARTQYRLQHPHIVRVHDFLQDRGLVGCVQEWCNGGELVPKEFASPGHFPLDVIRENFLPLLDALEQVHEQGLVHRDLKPQNILLHRQDNRTLWKLSDFGLLKDPKDDSHTHTGMVMGTFRYISPEQFRESKHVDPQTDIYSMGVVLYELLLGRVPFLGKMPRLAVQVMSQPAPFPPTFPTVLRDVLEKALAKDPKARFADCSTFREAIVGAIGELVPAEPAATLPSVSEEVAPVESVDTSAPETLDESVVPPSAVVEDAEPTNWLSWKKLGFAIVVLLVAGGLGWWVMSLFTPTDSIRSSVARRQLGQDAALFRTILLRSSLSINLTNAIRYAELTNWGHTRYNLKRVCHYKRQCFWYAHFVHHTFSILRKGCEAGDKTSCHWYHVARKKKLKPVRWARRSIPLYKKACNLKERRACYALGKLYQFELGAVRKARVWYRKACDWKHAQACVALARSYTSKSRKLQFVRLQQACSLGNSEGCLLWGEALRKKEGAQEKVQTAFRMACNLKDQRGCHLLQGLALEP